MPPPPSAAIVAFQIFFWAICAMAGAQVFYAPPVFDSRPVQRLDAHFDPALPGATPEEERAALVWSLRQGLLLGALQCHAPYPALLTTDSYNGVLMNHSAELARAHHGLQGYFARTVKGAKPAQAAFDLAVTRMTARYATGQGKAAFYQVAGAIGRRALLVPPGQLATFATAHLGELRASLAGGRDRAFPMPMSAALRPHLPPPSMARRCWSAKNRYNVKACG